MATFDARHLATAWLAVTVAAAPRTASPAIARTVSIDSYDGAGIRLTSTDGLILLTAWVPEADYPDRAAPELEEVPDRNVVARDPDGRGSGLMGYLLKLVGDDPDADDAIDLEVRLSLTAFRPATPDTPGQLPGMGPRHVALDVTDLERVYLERLDGGTFPAWARLLVGHEPRMTSYVALNPAVLDRVAKAGKFARSNVRWYFAGEDKPARVEVPGPVATIDGLVMPVRLELEPPPPADEAAATPENR